MDEITELRTEMTKRFDKLETILIGAKGDNGVCGRLGRVENNVEQNSEEIKRHKRYHWEVLILLVGVMGVAVNVLARFIF